MQEEEKAGEGRTKLFIPELNALNRIEAVIGRKCLFTFIPI